jgi:hypothetical protein
METIMQELYTNGPLTSQMEAHEDLISYQSGVYKVDLKSPENTLIRFRTNTKT